jgi:hypothetical protein
VLLVDFLVAAKEVEQTVLIIKATAKRADLRTI